MTPVLLRHDLVVWRFLKMAEKDEQRVCVKFCFKLGKTATETHQLLQQVYGDAALGRTQTFEWFGRLKESRDSVKDDPRAGRLKTSVNDNQVELVKEKVMSDTQLTVRELSGKLTIWLCSDHFDRKSRHEKGSSQVCSTLAFC